MNKAIEVNNEEVSTIEQAWDSFSLACMAQDVGTIQQTEMRRAFYAGAVISIGLAAVSMQDGPGALMAKMGDLIAECDEYADLVKMGVA